MFVLKVHLCPNAKKNAVCGMYDEEYVKISITAQAVDGKANKALIEFLSGKFGVAKSKIVIVRGMTSRNKMLEIDVAEQVGVATLKSLLI